MSSLERKREKAKPLYLNTGVRSQTCAEIVSEARRSLRTLKTQRPFTPREEHRQLFGEASSRACDGRPPSTFSLHARNFEAPDSRPNSGTRLSPLENRPKLPFAQDEDESCSVLVVAALPKPPSERAGPRRGPAGARAKLIQAASLSRLPPVTQHTQDVAQGTQQEGTGKAKCARVTGAADPGAAVSHRTESSGAESENPKKETECGHGDSAGSDDVDESMFWNSEVLPVLQELEAVNPDSGKGVSEKAVERLCDACTRLHDALAERGLLGRRCGGRAALLRALFRLIDLGSDRLSLALARLILALSVSGNNLLNICKLVFKISRSASNDTLFLHNAILDPLLTLLQCEDVGSCGEALLYCVGSLKLLSGNSALSRLLLAKDIIRILLQLSQRLIEWSTTDAITDTTNPRPPSQAIAGHILVQLTAALRNMADLSDSRPSFLSNQAFPALCLVLKHHHSDQDICVNVARLFSKLSSYAECCSSLADTQCCSSLFLDLLRNHSRKQDLVVRVLFIMGNLTARSSEVRLRFSEEGGVDVLGGLFQTYMQAELSPEAPQPPRAPRGLRQTPAQRDDVLVKLIRVLANLSIHPTVGTALAANPSCVQLLLQVLEVRSVLETEELVVNAAATINNLSYYQGESSVVRTQTLHISELLLRLLLSPSMEAVLEATRVFGNLSQIREVQHFIMQRKVYQFVMTLLDSKNPDICFAACGVLINVSVEAENRAVLRDQGVILKLTDCLRVFGPVDWQLAGLLCQTLWNCTEDGVPHNSQALLEILTLYLDQEEALQWAADDDVRKLQRVCWELDFLPVAQRLWSRIQRHVTLLEPMIEPS